MLTDSECALLRWRCRRGMLELDLIFERFLEKALPTLTHEQVVIFKRLLECQDPDLYSWLMGYASPTDMELLQFVHFIRSHFRT